MAPPNVKIKHITRSPSSSGDTRFPKLDDCAHFHYENVELGPITVLLCDKQADSTKSSLLSSSLANKENEGDRICFLVTVISNRRKWVVRRSYKNFMFLDTQLHRCVYDRKYSLLHELTNITQDHTDGEDNEEQIRTLLSEYLERFSQLAGSLISCGPVLNWFELDNRGNRLIVTDEVAINTPAVAASYVVVPYSAQATDEISFEVGDMISVIDMPPTEESSWWRGKKGFEVGFFPSECVEVIGDKVPHSFKLSSTSSKPVFRKHGKLVAFFRSFLLSRPSRRRLKQSGILKERVFGCDLGEHLLNTGREIPLVLKCCTEFIEEHGVVDGIYRLSGVSSNIQRLRLAFDEDRSINLGDPETVHDIHSVASLLKMYFRELPNPLLTYQLYDKFVSAVQSCEEVRLLRIRDVVQQLPPPHFRTLQYLMNHLARVASYGDETGMTPKNIAIVWAPNLLRSRDVENGGVGALHVVGVQAVLTEYLIRFSDLIFDEKVPMLTNTEQGEVIALRARPKSLAISTPTKLLSLEEARARALSTHLPLTQQKYIEVGGGPDKLPSKYHTVIELPLGKQSLPKLKKSPSGWKSFFSRGWYSGSARDKCRPSLRSSRKASTGSLPPASIYLSEKPTIESETSCNRRKKLRTVKSAESLVHCAKESQSENRDDLPGTSHKSPSPIASTDSSNSFEVASPLSKSPSLQKHTRSSSHESYFESNSMEIISEPSFEEDEHGLFYYVTEQMKMFQDTSPEPWNASKSDFKKEPTFLRHSKFFECHSNGSKMDSHSSNVHPLDTEKVVRKQKLSTPDDFAHAKVQKLSEKEIKLGDDETYSDRAFESQGLSSSSNDPATNYNFGISSDPCLSLEKYYLSPNSDHFSPNNSFMDNSDFQLDPILIYDSIINKHSSCVSGPENESGSSKTVVERYGNAETVLVEVHATQDSSSDEESYIPILKFEETKLPKAIIDDALSDEQELLPNVPVTRDISKPSVSDSDSVSTDAGVGDLTVISNELVSNNDDDDYEKMDDRTMIELEEYSEKTVESEPYSPSSLITDEIVENVFLPDASAPSPQLDIFNDSTSPNQSDTAFSGLMSRNRDLHLKLDFSPKEEMLKLEQTSDSCQSYSMNTPPSPVYPTKCSKFEDFQSLRIKMENIPIHKKKKVLNIPSPSSPVEEVRKRFELHAANSQKLQDCIKVDAKSPVSSKDINKLSSRQKIAFEKQDDSEVPEKRKSEGIQNKKDEVMFSSKRHSEPFLKSQKAEIVEGIDASPFEASNQIIKSPSSHYEVSSKSSLCDVKTRPISLCTVPNIESQQPMKNIVRDTELSQVAKSPACDVQPISMTKSSPCRTDPSPQVLTSPVSGENQSGKCKSSQPSLFTQLKIRKLQSLKADKSGGPPEHVDPWSDPILDLQKDYHPMVSLSQLEEAANVKNEVTPANEPLTDKPVDSKSFPECVDVSSSIMKFESDCIKLKETPEPSKISESSKIANDQPTTCSTVNREVENPHLNSESENQQTVQKCAEICIESEAVRRERINRIKEERRAQLREKLKTESFRLEAEEKEKIQTKFRLRKDSARHSIPSNEIQDDIFPKEVTKSDKAVETDSTDITETGTYCDLSKERKDADYLGFCKINEQQLSATSRSSVSELDRSSYGKLGRYSLKQVLSETDILQQNKPINGRKSNRAYEDSRKWLSMPPSDIRDKVAIFERSKDANELCRLGPNGKFPPKQNSSSLASSFVR